MLSSSPKIILGSRETRDPFLINISKRGKWQAPRNGQVLQERRGEEVRFWASSPPAGATVIGEPLQRPLEEYLRVWITRYRYMTYEHFYKVDFFQMAHILVQITALGEKAVQCKGGVFARICKYYTKRGTIWSNSKQVENATRRGSKRWDLNRKTHTLPETEGILRREPFSSPLYWCSIFLAKNRHTQSIHLQHTSLRTVGGTYNHR